MTIVPYNPGMIITNTAQLPKGTGAKYLEVSTVKEGELIAVQWRRAKPTKLEKSRALIQFK